MASVLDRADAEAASLPPLDRPALAGASLVTTVASLGLGMGAHFLADITGTLDGRLRAFAIGSAATTLVAGWTMAARFGSRHRRERRFMLAALAAWLAAVVAEGLRPSLPLGVPMAAAALSIWSIGPLLIALGRRSVKFRRQGPARQRIGPLAIAAGVAAIVGLAHEGLSLLHADTLLMDPLLLLEATAGGLACLGMAYLSANAVIIARGLGDVAIDPDRLVRARTPPTGPKP